MSYIKSLEIGKEYGYWTIIEASYEGRGGTKEGSRGGQKKYKCRCRCGNIKIVWKSHIVAKNSISCGCINKTSGPKNRLWGGVGEISGNYWNNIKRSAEGKRGRQAVGITLTISEAWDLFLKQKRRCALSGIVLNFNNERTASLDRIDSLKPYEVGNVQWVHKDINRMKNIFSQEYFINTCHLISSYNKKIKETV